MASDSTEHTSPFAVAQKLTLPSSGRSASVFGLLILAIADDVIE
jgi:hypothetical protein